MMKANKNYTLRKSRIDMYKICIEAIMKYKLVCVKSTYSSSPYWISHFEFIATKNISQLEKVAEIKIKKIN